MNLFTPSRLIFLLTADCETIVNFCIFMDAVGRENMLRTPAAHPHQPLIARVQGRSLGCLAHSTSTTHRAGSGRRLRAAGVRATVVRAGQRAYMNEPVGCCVGLRSFVARSSVHVFATLLAPSVAMIRHRRAFPQAVVVVVVWPLSSPRWIGTCVGSRCC